MEGTPKKHGWGIFWFLTAGTLKWVRYLVCIAGLLSCSNAFGKDVEYARFPSLTSSLNLGANQEFCGEKVPLKRREIKERFEKEMLLSLWNRAQVILWLKRSHRYLPHIEKALQENGLPDDLKYVAVAESALRPHAGSIKGAIGFWQFMKHTGRKYRLIINEGVDERRNLFASTGAAILYLKDLYGKFGSWTLAVAAYNMGEGGLEAEILEQQTDDYYSLYLSLETQRFLFRILSIKLILSAPERYGFRLSKDDYYPALTFDRVQVECPRKVPIQVVAKAARTGFKVIKDLNPEIRGHDLASGSHQILVPKGAAVGFQERYSRLAQRFLSDRKQRIYTVRKGDNLSSIAERFEIPVAVLIISNQIDPKLPIHPGDRLVIYPKDK